MLVQNPGIKHRESSHMQKEEVRAEQPQRSPIAAGGGRDSTATTSPKAEKRIPSAWNENHEISFWQEPECD